MIPARRVYATLAKVSQTFSSLAYAVEFALQERNPEPRDVYDTFFRFQEAFNEMHEVLPSSEIIPDAREFSYLNNAAEHNTPKTPIPGEHRCISLQRLQWTSGRNGKRSSGTGLAL